MTYRPLGWPKEAIGYVLLGIMFALYWLWFTAARAATFIEEKRAQKRKISSLPISLLKREIEKPCEVIPFKKRPDSR